MRSLIKRLIGVFSKKENIVSSEKYESGSYLIADESNSIVAIVYVTRDCVYYTRREGKVFCEIAYKKSKGEKVVRTLIPEKVAKNFDGMQTLPAYNGFLRPRALHDYFVLNEKKM